MNIEFRISGKVIETDRLILRAFEYDDLEDFYEYASVEGVGENAGWKHHTDKEESIKILDSFVKNNKVFAIYHKQNEKVIGSIGVEKYDEDEFPEFFEFNGRKLGFVLNKDYWGKGIMPEACKAVIDYLFNEIDLDFLICSYYNYNIQSKRVQEKLGFKIYGHRVIKTGLDTFEDSTDNLLINPNKKFKFEGLHLKNE